MPENLDSLIYKALIDDPSEFFDSLLSESNHPEYIDECITKVGELFEQYSSSSSELVSRIIKFLEQLLSIVDLSEDSGRFLTKQLLLVIVDEHCTILNLRNALSIFNVCLENEMIAEWLLNDDSFEGSIQILGRQLPFVGDFVTQASLFETLCKIIFDRDKTDWAGIWFSNEKICSLLLNTNLKMFHMECRKFLNQINRYEENQRVFSFPAISVCYGFIQRKKPLYSEEFWIDFNYDSQSISFYCLELEHNTAKVETIFINQEVVEKYTVKAERFAKSQELCITLKGSCGDLVNASLAQKSNVIRIKFYCFLDIKKHLENLFGPPYSKTIQTISEEQYRRDSHRNTDLLSATESNAASIETYRNRKVPICHLTSFSDPQLIRSDASHSQKKISNSADIIPIDYSEDLQSQIQSQYSQGRRVSNSAEIIAIGDFENTQTDVCYEVRRVSSSFPVSVLDSEETGKANESKKYKQASIMQSDKVADDIEMLENRLSADDWNESDQQQPDVESSSNEPFRKRIKRGSKNSYETKDSRQKNLLRKRRYRADSCQQQLPSKTQKTTAKRKSRKSSDEERQEELEKSLKILHAKTDSSDSIKRKEDESVEKALPKKLKTMFATDTETGSSELSWFNPRKSILFQSPKHTYYKRKTVAAILSRNSLSKSKSYQPISSSARTRSVSKRNLNKGSDSETKSKSAFSDIDNYKLVVEKSKREPPVTLSGLFRPKQSQTASESTETHRIDIGEKDFIHEFDGSTYLQEVDDEAILVEQGIPQVTSEQFTSSERYNKEFLGTSKYTFTPNIVRIQFKPTEGNGIEEEHEVWDDKSNRSMELNITENVDFKKFADDIESKNVLKNACTKNIKSSTPKPHTNGKKLIKNQKNIKSDFTVGSKNKQRKSKTRTDKKHQETSFFYDQSDNSTGTQASYLQNIPKDDIILMSPSTLQMHSKSNNEKVVSPSKTLSHDTLSHRKYECGGKKLHMIRFLESLSEGSSPHPNNDELTNKDYNQITKANSTDIKRSRNKSSGHNSGDIPAKLSNTKNSVDDFEKYSSSTASTVKRFDDSNSTVVEVLGASSPKQNYKKSSEKNSKKSQKMTIEPCPTHKVVSKKTKRPADSPVEFKFRPSPKHLNEGMKHQNENSTIPISSSTSSVNGNVLKQKNCSSLSNLVSEMNKLTSRLLRTIQKHSLEFRAKVTLLRQNIVNTADELILQDSEFNEKDLKCMAKNIIKCRTEIQRRLKKILYTGQEYFELERKHKKMLEHIQEKAMRKYITGAQAAEDMTIKSVELQILSKAKAMFRAFLKKITLL